MAFTAMIISGLFGALSNLCMRISMEKNGTAKAFFVFQLTFTFLVTLVLCPLRRQSFDWNAPVLVLALITGCSLGLMKVMLGKALQKGPPGLTFATVNAASVMPALIIVFFIGALIDYQLSSFDLLGLLFVLAGLFWAGWDGSYKKGTGHWILFATSAFAFNVMYMFFTEIRAIFLDSSIQTPWMPQASSLASEWFIPMVFAAAAGMHGVLFFNRERRIPHTWEVSWGVLGGIFNGICAFLFVSATEIASIQESTIIFPIFSISLIIFCNIWGQWLYREKVNWPANLLCVCGIFVTSLGK